MTQTLSDFDYHLPPANIAQTPADKRDQSKLMRVNKQTGELNHTIFSNITNEFQAGDTLVLNNTQVIPARIMGRRKTGGKIEIMLITPLSETEWQVMLKPAKRLANQETISVTPQLSCKIIEKQVTDHLHHVEFIGQNITQETIFQAGKLPLPPYVKPTPDTQQKLNNRYQTVYAQCQGAVAAPTAGLHFTNPLLKILQEKGVHICFVTLHVGYGTFQPLTDTSYHNANLHTEHYIMPQKTAHQLNIAKKNKTRIIAVGTTVARTLESNISQNKFHFGSFKTQLFIKPGYRFKTCDALITNFHLPKSSLLCLVSAYCGHTNLHHAYQTAITKGYRFYSFGDAMMIV